MYNPFGGNRFPYTNFHELNLDWMIEVVKRFFDTYPETVEEIQKKLNAPVNDGSAGDFLMNLGNGQTEWTTIAAQYTEIIYQAVDEWLDEHPEATTTVQDGSITPAKLNAALLKAFNTSGNVIQFFPSFEEAQYTQNIALVKTPNKAILMDTGEEADFTLFKTYFDSLFAAGIFTNLDYIIISHYHFDHVDNLESFIEAYPHNGLKVFLPPTIEGHYATRSDLVERYNAIIAYLSANNIDYEVINSKKSVVLDQDLVTAEFLNTDVVSWAYYDVSETHYNNYSMVTLLKVGETCSMYPGDILSLAQKYIYEHNNLPSMNLFVYPHHALEDTDNLQFLTAVNPEHTIITTSSNRILTANKNSIANFVTGKKYALAYGKCTYINSKAAGTMINGIPLERIGRAESTITTWVNNEYTGDGWDGSEAKPYRSLDEAMMHITENTGCYNRIRVVPTSTSYGSAYVRDVFTSIEISSSVDIDHKPIFDNIQIANCAHVELYWLKFTGTPKSTYDIAYHLGVIRSNAYVSGCEFVGNSTPDVNAIMVSHNEDLYLVNNIFRNFAPTTGQGNGIHSYQYGSVVSKGNTFDNVDAPYRLEYLKVTIESADTLQNGSRWIIGSATRGIPFTVAPEAITATNLAQVGGSAYSDVVRYNSQLAIIHGPHLYNILTGEEITVS